MGARSSGVVAAACVAAVLGVGCGAGQGQRCGDGVQGAATQRVPRRQRQGPYCLSLAAEGVGSLRVSINRGSGTGEGEGAGEPEPMAGGVPGAEVPLRPSMPVDYVRVSPRGVVPIADVCALPGARRVLVNVDDQYSQLPEPGLGGAIPFPVRYWDQPVAPPFGISSNGYITLSSSTYGSLSGVIPSPGPPVNTIAAHWSDLVTRSGGVCYAVTGNAPGRMLVVQWQDARYCCSDSPMVHLTFQIVVHEARPPRQNNVIDVIYQRMDGVNPGYGQNAGVEAPDGVRAALVQLPLSAPRIDRFVPTR